MNKNLLLKLLTIILIIINSMFIFHFSAEKAEVSKNTSKKVTEKVLEITVEDFHEKPEPTQKKMIKKADSKIRSMAHFLEYTLLGFLLVWHLYLYKIKVIKKASLAFSGCLLYSVADEIHQIYVPGRSFQFIDVATDCGGALLGIAVFFLVIFLIFKISKKSVVL